MPKRVPDEAKRVALNCLVSPETKRLLERLRDRQQSQGEIVDRAVAAWANFGATAGPPLAKALNPINHAARPFKRWTGAHNLLCWCGGVKFHRLTK